MGNFAAHILPGTVFISLGLWWYISTLLLYRKTGVHLHRNCFWYWKEPLLKVLLCLGGMAAEVHSAHFTLMPSEGNASGNDWQHVTMYLLFLGTALYDVLAERMGGSWERVSHLSYVAAFLVEAGLFYSHLHGRAVLDTQCHILVACSGFLTSASLLWCYVSPGCVVSTALYHSLVISHGLWFLETGFILLSPFETNVWKKDSDEHAMMTNVFFCWTYVTTVLVMTLICWFVWRDYKPGQSGKHHEHNRLLLSEMD